MQVVTISGSPRKGQNSEKMIEMVNNHFQLINIQTKSIKLSEINITPCINCNYCKSNDSCNQDENANTVNTILQNADAIIIVSPVYFGSMTGQLKCLLDKTLPLRRNGFKLKGKIGAAIATGGSRNGGQELTINDIHAWMLVHGMILVGDNNHFGGTVHLDVDADEFGRGTVKGVISAVEDILNRIK